jgi:hypothetical protein
VTWPATSNFFGSPVTAYRINFKNSAGTLNTNLVYCDGSSSVVIAARSCSVPMSVFWTATYLVNVGQPIIVQVEALNGIGYSIPSVDNSFAAVAIIVP